MLGCLTQGCNIFLGGEGINLAQMRIPGILQRIAFAYFVVAMMKLYLPVYTTRGFVLHGSWDDARPHPLSIFSHYALHWLVAIAFFLLYLCIMLFVTVPTWSWSDHDPGVTGHWEMDTDACSVPALSSRLNRSATETCTRKWTWQPAITYTQVCDKAGDLTPACSATRMVDKWVRCRLSVCLSVCLSVYLSFFSCFYCARLTRSATIYASSLSPRWMPAAGGGGAAALSEGGGGGGGGGRSDSGGLRAYVRQW
eukprot:COSAG01_NODE_6024_length_3895_cov_4.417808_2_plen_253_part_00